MFKTNMLFFNRFQHLSAKSDFLVHHILLDIEHTKAALTGDTGDNFIRGISTSISCLRNDQGTGRFGSIGISDIDRNPGMANGKNGILM